jgi:hypothetical protein
MINSQIVEEASRGRAGGVGLLVGGCVSMLSFLACAHLNNYTLNIAQARVWVYLKYVARADRAAWHVL